MGEKMQGRHYFLIIDLFWSKYTLISLSFMWVHYYFMSASAYTDSKHLKNNNKNKQVRHHDSDSTASACPGTRSASINSPEWHPLTKNQMTEEFVAVLITRWIPCVSSSKQLGAEDTEPFTALWQYCNTWKPQPRSPEWQSGMSSCTNPAQSMRKYLVDQPE